MTRATCALAVVLVTVAITTAPAAPASSADAPEGFPIVDPIDEARAVHEYQVVAFEVWASDQLQLAVDFVRAVIDGERPRPGPSSSLDLNPAPSGGDGGCYDGPVPAYIVTRESGGNPGAVNPSSGAFGCFQFLPSTWASSCSDLSRDVAGQIECANRISNGGSNLNPWASTR